MSRVRTRDADPRAWAFEQQAVLFLFVPAGGDRALSADGRGAGEITAIALSGGPVHGRDDRSCPCAYAGPPRSERNG